MDRPCYCPECGIVHVDVLVATGRWPEMSHADAQVLRSERVAMIQDWLVRSIRRQASGRASLRIP